MDYHGSSMEQPSRGTKDSYEVAEVKKTDQGVYSLAISNPLGSSISRKARLTLTRTTPNSAPVLKPIADVILEENSELTVVNAATDED